MRSSVVEIKKSESQSFESVPTTSTTAMFGGYPTGTVGGIYGGEYNTGIYGGINGINGIETRTIGGGYTTGIPSGIQYTNECGNGIEQFSYPIEGEDVVITGVSGRFPEGENVEEFSRYLFNNCGGEYPTTGIYGGLPNKIEKLGMMMGGMGINNVESKLFGIDETRFVEPISQKMKVLLNVTYESLVDSGFNPIELKGSKTGVYIGTVGGEFDGEEYVNKSTLIYKRETTPCKYAHNIAGYFNFIGPVYNFETTKTNGLIPLINAIEDIRSGVCEQAIVGGINFCMDEKKFFETYGYPVPEDVKIKMVGDESVSVIVLQKRQSARRFYCSVLKSKLSTETGSQVGGWKNETVMKVLGDVYNGQVDPKHVFYVEQHGCKQFFGDNVTKVSPVGEFFGKYRPSGFYLGTTKPFIGHSDTVSGITSLVKMIVSIQKGMVPTREVYVCENGKFKVHDGKVVIRNGLMGLTSVGLGGCAHIVLQPHYEWMMNKYVPTSFWNKTHNLVNLSRQPRLFTFSGRTEDELQNIFEEMNTCPTDVATHVLMGPNAITSPITHPYRGFTVLNGSRPVREIRRCTGEKKPIWYVLSGMGTQWTGMGKELLQIECFRNSIYRSANILKPYNIDLVHLLLKENEQERFLHTSVMIPAIQIGLIDCLKTLGVEPEGIVGHSFGELVAAYVDGCLTHEETMLTAYYRGKFIEESNLPNGGMAIVSLPWEELQRQLPQYIVPAYFNTKDSVVVSGPKKAIVQFVEELKLRGIYAKEIESNGIALNSYLLQPVVPKLKQTLERIISTKTRTPRWISTSVPECKWESEVNKYITSDYFVNNLISPVFFHQAVKRIPTNAITIEIGPRSVLKKVLLKSLGEKLTLVNFMTNEKVSPIEHFWNNFGRLYTEGVNIDAVKLFVPEQQIYPVPIGTRSLSSILRRQVPTTTTYGGSYGGYYGRYPEQTSRFTYPGEIYGKPEYRSVYPGEIYGKPEFRSVYPGGECTTEYPFEQYKYTSPYTPVSPFPYTPTHNVEGVTKTTTTTTTVGGKYGNTHVHEIDISKGSKQYYLNGHQIDGKIMFPTSGYLNLVWKTLSTIRKIKLEELPVVFEDVQVHYPTVIESNKVKFYVTIDDVSGKFEVTNGGKTTLVTGRVFVSENGTFEPTTIKGLPTWSQKWSTNDLLEKEQIYKQLRLRGLDYNGLFQGLSRVNVEGTQGELCWTGRWVPFIESMFQMHTIGKQGIQMPTQIRRIRIDPRVQLRNVNLYDVNSNIYTPKTNDFLVQCVYDPNTRSCVAGGVEINGLYSTLVPKTYFQQPVVLERVNFVPYFERRGIDEEFCVPEVEYRPTYEYVDTYLNECKHHLTNILKKLEVQTPYGGIYGTPSYTGIYGTPSYTGIYGTPIPTTTTTTQFYNPTTEFGGKQLNGKFLQLLKEISTIEGGSQYEQRLREIISRKVGSLYDAWNTDNIFNHINRDVYLKSLLDTVCENVTCDYTQSPKLKVLEISPSYNVFGTKIQKFLPTHPQYLVDYHYLPVGEMSDEEFVELKRNCGFPINKVEWNIRLSQEIPQLPQLNNFDLIIFNGSIGSLPFFEDKLMVKRWLQTVCDKMLKRDGFMMVHEYVNHFDTLNHLERLERFVRQQQLKDTFNYKFQCESEWRKLFEESCGFYPVSVKSDSILSSMFLYRKPRYTVVPREYETIGCGLRDYEIYVNEVDSFHWIEKVKQALNDTTCERLWLISENAPTSGIIGLVNCLRREPRGERIRCVFVADSIGKPWRQTFDKIKLTDLVMNVYKNGKWGSYRYVRDLTDNERFYLRPESIVNHAHLDFVRRGDLSTLSWVQSPEPITRDINEMIVKVCYAGLNHRDITGRVFPEYKTTTKYTTRFNEQPFGMEFSGYVKDKRYMGLTPKRAFSTSLVADWRHCWEVPREWTLEQGATVPYSYAVAYHGLVVKGGIRGGETVLIHSGATPVGQACIAVALHHGCKVFTTVGTQEKREYLMSLFPGKLTERSFGNTKDIMFEQHIMRETQGRGCDVVLNTLNGEQLYASLRCLVNGGRFVELGNGIYEPTQFTSYFNNVSFHNVNLESLLEPENYEWKRVYQLVEEGLRLGVVRPIRSMTFDRTCVQDGFKHIMQTKPVHKVLIKIWEPKEQFQPINALPRLWLSPYHTYVITGGLGTFGLELATWMVKRGARKLLITSKYGIQNGCQQKKLQILQDQYGAIISVSSYDLKDESECVLMLKEATELSEEKKIGGIFHLDELCEDGLLETLTPEKFRRVLESKYLSGCNLDKYTRNMDGYFVVFSSVTSGKGFAGQTPFGYANSAIERLCELRRQDGKHAVAIQWGTPGVYNSKYVNECDVTIGGCVPTKLNSCLNVLERILLKGDNQSIWSCYVPEEKYNEKFYIPEERCEKFYIPEERCEKFYIPEERCEKSYIPEEYRGLPRVIYGRKYELPSLYEIVRSNIREPRLLRNDVQLIELGLEPSVLIHLKKVLEECYQTKVNNIQYLTIEKLRQLESKFVGINDVLCGEYNKPTFTRTLYPTGQQKINYLMPRRALEKLNEIELTNTQPVVIIHPIEGHVNMLKSWAKHMKYPVYGMQFTSDALCCDSIEKLAEYYWSQLENEFKTVTKFHLAGYSFGSSVAFEMALKKSGRIASLTFLDGNHSYVNSCLNTLKSRIGSFGGNMPEIESECLYTFINQYTQIQNRKHFVQQLVQLKDLEDRIKFATRELYTTSQFSFEPMDVELAAKSFVQKMLMSLKYQPKSMLRLPELLLIRPTQRSEIVDLFGEDYGLGSVFNGKLRVFPIEGDQRSFLESSGAAVKVASIFNDYLMQYF